MSTTERLNIPNTINWLNSMALRDIARELGFLSAENEALRAGMEAEHAAFKTCAQERYNYHANLVDMRYQLTAVTNERDALRAQVEALIKPVIQYTQGEWYMASSIDEMQAFFESRLPAIRATAYANGYAIGVHGSMRRDLDLIAAPWRDGAADAETLAHAIARAACGIDRDGAYNWEQKPFGRIATSLPICWVDNGVDGAGHIDLSVMPQALTRPAVPEGEVHEPKCPALDGGDCTCTRSDKHDQAVDRSWARFCAKFGDGPDAPYPGMISAFERYYSQSFADKEWRTESAVWAAAWKAAMLAAPQPSGEVSSDDLVLVPRGLLGSACAVLCRSEVPHTETLAELRRYTVGDLSSAAPQPEALAKARSQHDADSRELRSLCAARDEARRERNTLRAKTDELTIENASLQSSVQHLSGLCDEQRAILVEVEKECGTDDYGLEFEDGDSKIIDRVRAHLAMVAAPQPEAQPTEAAQKGGA